MRVAALAVLVLAGCMTGGTLGVPRADDHDVRALLREQWEPFFDKEDRANEVMWKLGLANAALCGAVGPLGGWTEIDKDFYDDHARARVFRFELSGLKPERVVQHVVPGGPAWNAGLRPGDRMFWQKESGVPTVRGIVLDVTRGGSTFKVGPFDKLFVCSAPLAVMRHASANALTDGERIAITSGMMDFVANDHELAFVLAHELAHVALGHVGKKKGNSLLGALVGGLVDGLLGTWGTAQALADAGAAAFSKDFEREADYMGTYMMARAGFDPDSIAPLWARATGEAPAVWGTTHPVDAERELNVSIYAQEISTKLLAGEPLNPVKKQ